MIHARLGWFTTHARTLVSRAAGGAVPELMAVPAHHVGVVVPALLLPPVLVVGAGVLVSPGAALALALALVGSFILHLWSQRHLVRADADRGASEASSATATLQLVDHLDLLVTSAGPTRSLEMVEPEWRRQEDALASVTRATVPAGIVSEIATRLPLVGALVWILATTPDAREALAVLLLALLAGTPLAGLALFGVTAGSLRTALHTLDEVVSAPRLPAPTTAAAPVSSDRGIIVRDVSRHPALDHLEAALKPGTTVRVTGASGSGKTTLLGLLMRFEDPDYGEILLDGAPLPSLSPDALAARISYVPQDPALSSGTLAGNIVMGAPDADGQALATAVECACLGEVVTAAPDGVSRDVSSRGATLSVGEQQRVSIARAVHRLLVTDADLLVLDEPTASLDDATASQVTANLRGLVRELRKTRPLTVVVVSHREGEDWAQDAALPLD